MIWRLKRMRFTPAPPKKNQIHDGNEIADNGGHEVQRQRHSLWLGKLRPCQRKQLSPCPGMPSRAHVSLTRSTALPLESR